MTNVQARRLVFSSISVGLGLLIASGYLLPHTVWPDILGLTKLDIVSFGAYTVPQCAVVVAIAIAILILFADSALKFPKAVPLWSLIGCYIMVYAIAMLWPSGDDYNRIACSPVVLSLAAGLASARIVGSSERAIALIALIGVMTAGYSFVYYLNGMNLLLSGTVHRAGGIFNSPLELAYSLVLCLPASLYWSLSKSNPFILLASMIGSALIGAVLYLTFSWMALLAAVLSLLTLFYYNKPRKNQLQAAFAVCLLLCMSLLIVRTEGPRNLTSSIGSFRSRTALWSAGLHIFISHPLTGVGLGNVRIAAEGYQNGSRASISMVKCMDLPLQWLDEMGIGGGVLLIALCLALRRILKDRSTLLSHTFTSMICATAIVSLLDVPVGIVDQTAPTCLMGVLLGGVLMLPAESSVVKVSS